MVTHKRTSLASKTEEDEDKDEDAATEPDTAATADADKVSDWRDRARANWSAVSTSTSPSRLGRWYPSLSLSLDNNRKNTSPARVNFSNDIFHFFSSFSTWPIFEYNIPNSILPSTSPYSLLRMVRLALKYRRASIVFLHASALSPKFASTAAMLTCGVSLPYVVRYIRKASFKYFSASFLFPLLSDTCANFWRVAARPPTPNGPGRMTDSASRSSSSAFSKRRGLALISTTASWWSVADSSENSRVGNSNVVAVVSFSSSSSCFFCWSIRFMQRLSSRRTRASLHFVLLIASTPSSCSADATPLVVLLLPPWINNDSSKNFFESLKSPQYRLTFPAVWSVRERPWSKRELFSLVIVM